VERLSFLHRLTFTRGSDALEFVRTLRELSAGLAETPSGLEPIAVYGSRIVNPDAPSELYMSVGALTLAYALGMESLAKRSMPKPTDDALPADMALLFASKALPGQGGPLIVER
jgi:hypothetical protein